MEKELDLSTIGQQVAAAVEELLTVAAVKPGQLFVVGCSTSEVRGAKIGSAGSEEVAKAILAALSSCCASRQIWLAIQCCEHLNRALVVERQVVTQFGLEEVSVVPVPKAGGALAAQAMRDFTDPVVVETVQAHAGMDIGATLMGMHLRRVAVPIRLQQKYIGQAPVTAARTRPKMIGGGRAVYEMPSSSSN
ncbi:MAG: TIGR01440 family protein [Negativicutes bacterium]|nr:TIGR01440 family protein [Negativicutes bacterium]